jgi:hypothetical protein
MPGLPSPARKMAGSGFTEYDLSLNAPGTRCSRQNRHYTSRDVIDRNNGGYFQANTDDTKMSRKEFELDRAGATLRKTARTPRSLCPSEEILLSTVCGKA